MTTINGITIEEHTGLVWSVVGRYRGSCTPTCEPDDLFQVGMVGLMRAAETYDAERAKFSTYAYHWIRQAVRRTLDDTSRPVRVPVHRLDSLRMRRQPLPPRAVSLNETIDHESRTTRQDLLPSGEAPDSDYLLGIDHERVRALLDALTPREKEILLARFWRDETLEEVGKRFDVCRERIRQLEAQALAKLRSDAAQTMQG